MHAIRLPHDKGHRGSVKVDRPADSGRVDPVRAVVVLDQTDDFVRFDDQLFRGTLRWRFRCRPWIDGIAVRSCGGRSDFRKSRLDVSSRLGVASAPSHKTAAAETAEPSPASPAEAAASPAETAAAESPSESVATPSIALLFDDFFREFVDDADGGVEPRLHRVLGNTHCGNAEQFPFDVIGELQGSECRVEGRTERDVVQPQGAHHVVNVEPLVQQGHFVERDVRVQVGVGPIAKLLQRDLSQVDRNALVEVRFDLTLEFQFRIQIRI